MGFDSWSIRDKIIMIWALIIASVALIFVLFSLSSLISDNSSNIASWVQAIGSITAIGSGYYVAQYQLKETLKNQIDISKEQNRIVQREKYLRLAFMVSEISANAKSVPPKSLYKIDLRSVLGSNFDELIRQVKEFDVKDLPSPIWITEIITLKNHVISIGSIISSDFKDNDLEGNQILLDIQIQRLIHRASQLYKELLELATKISTEEEKISDMNGVAAMAARQNSNPINVVDMVSAELAKKREAVQQTQSAKPS